MRTPLIRGLVVGLSLVLLSCRQEYSPEDNEKYLRETLGGLAIRHIEVTGEAPISIEAAMNRLDETLTHRGDYYGGGMLYERLDKQSFRISSNGKDRLSDTGDDLTVTYRNGDWID